MPAIEIQLRQSGPTTTEAAIPMHRVSIGRPEAKGGQDQGPMGGELLLSSLGGCFASNLFAAARAREIALEDVAIAIAGELADAPARFSAVRMTVSGGAAARARIVANTLRTAVDLSIDVA